MKSSRNDLHSVASPPGLRRNPSSLVALSLALFAMAAVSPKTNAMSIDINTKALNGTSALLEFSLLDGDLTENNQATIAGLATDGTGSLLSHDCSVSCVENAGSYTISDTGGFGQFIQNLTLGNDVFFNLDFSNLFAGGNPDRLVLSLLDPNTNFTLTSTNLNLTDATPVQDALLTVDFTGGTGNLIREATASNPAVGITGLPSPGPWSLILPWGLWLAAVRSRLFRK